MTTIKGLETGKEGMKCVRDEIDQQVTMSRNRRHKARLVALRQAVHCKVKQTARRFIPAKIPDFIAASQGGDHVAVGGGAAAVVAHRRNCAFRHGNTA